MAARTSTPLRLKLLPQLGAGFPRRAARLGLPTSTLLASLVWNDALKPSAALAALPGSTTHVRVPLSCSLRPRHMRLARARARQLDLSVNAYLEALVAADLARGGSLQVLEK